MKSPTSKSRQIKNEAPARKSGSVKKASAVVAEKEEIIGTLEQEDPKPAAEKDVKGPAFRYSDEDLNEFRDKINERLAIAREELSFLQGQLIGKDSRGIEESSDLRLSLEDGSGAMDREQLSLLTSRQVQYISNLEKALIRIHNKTYGVCRETGKLIDKARLRAVPHATLSIEAKKGTHKK